MAVIHRSTKEKEGKRNSRNKEEKLNTETPLTQISADIKNLERVTTNTDRYFVLYLNRSATVFECMTIVA